MGHKAIGLNLTPGETWRQGCQAKTAPPGGGDSLANAKESGGGGMGNDRQGKVRKTDRIFPFLLLLFLSFFVFPLDGIGQTLMANEPLGGFYALDAGPYGPYSSGGTAIIDWRDFEPEEGVYRWELLKDPQARFVPWQAVFDARLRKLPSPGTSPTPAAAVYTAYEGKKKVRLKLRVTEGAMPLWLFGGEDVNGKSPSSYGTICAYKTYEQGWSKKPECDPAKDIIVATTYPLYPEKESCAEPVWWNPMFQEKMIRVLKVIGAFVEKDPVYRAAVEFVEASVGSYGEMILYGKSSTFMTDGHDQVLFRAAGYSNARYSESVQKLIAAYMEAFPSFPIALSIGTGLYAFRHDDGSGVESVLEDVVSKTLPRYGSRLYLKFAGFGGNRADHTFRYYCPDKTRCIYESFGGIGQWMIDGLNFPFFCFENSTASACRKQNADGTEEKIQEDPSRGAARFERVLQYALHDKAYIVMLWHADYRAIGDPKRAVTGLTDAEASQVREQFIAAMGRLSPQLIALGKIQPQGLETYALEVKKEGSGKGRIQSINIDCGEICSKVYARGTPVTLTAQADPGSIFGGWSGDCSGNGPCRLVMDGNKNVTAPFSDNAAGPDGSNPDLYGRNPSPNPNEGKEEIDPNGNGTQARGEKVEQTENGGARNLQTVSLWPRGAVVDLDGDGIDEVIWFNGEPGPVYAYSIKNGRLTRVDIRRDIAAPNWRMVGGGNLRPDGSYQIFWHNDATGQVYAWSMRGTTYLAEHYIHTVEDVRWKLVGVGDFDGDGSVDLLWHHQGSGLVYIWFMNGANFLHDRYVMTVEDLRWQVIGVGDLDGDGRTEVLWQHPQGGPVYVWHMDGARWLGDRLLRPVEDLNWKLLAIGRFHDAKERNMLWHHPISGATYIWQLRDGNFAGDRKIEAENDERKW
jgi:hypothetical protein